MKKREKINQWDADDADDADRDKLLKIKEIFNREDAKTAIAFASYGASGRRASSGRFAKGKRTRWPAKHAK